MKKTGSKQPKTIKQEYTCDPYQGSGALIAGVAPVGYEFVKIVRKGTKAVAHYKLKKQG